MSPSLQMGKHHPALFPFLFLAAASPSNTWHRVTRASPPCVPPRPQTTARTQVPKSNRGLSLIHPPSPSPALARLPPSIGCCIAPVRILGFSFITSLQSRNAGSLPNSAVLLGWIKPRVTPGQWVLTNAAHPAHQAGAEPPPLPGQNPPLHRPNRDGERWLPAKREGSSRQHLLLAKLDPGG